MASSPPSYTDGDLHSLSEVNIVLLGCRNSGKSSTGNIILGQKVFDSQESVQCVKRHGEVAGKKITVVEAPGWCCSKPVEESGKLLKDTIVHSVSQCPPGPRVVLVVVNREKSFKEKDREILSGLLTADVWSHTIVLFHFGDSLGDTSIERHIESEGQALQWLVEKCGNRFHVFNNEMEDDSQVRELLEKIEKTVTRNEGCHLITDVEKLRRSKEDKKSEEGKTRQMDYSSCFMNAFIYAVKFLQIVSYSPQLVFPPVWSIRRPLYFCMGFPQVLQVSSTSKKHADLNSAAKKDPQAPDSGHTSTDTELFTPELVENRPEDENRDEYRFLCPHAGQFQCKLTNLVFVMKKKAVLMYRVVPWDRQILDGLRNTEPAGPLYSVNCVEGSISFLHLPHCEIHWDVSDTDGVKLTVARVTGGNVENLPPQKVTDTHVIIDVQRHHLSCAGLVKELLFHSYPIRAQVLLFCTETEEHKINKLQVHLLPGNVPVNEVQKQQNSNTHIKTSSECQLTPGNIYRPGWKTTDHNLMSQPEEEMFNYDYGPESTPTFEMMFNPEVDEFTLSILDENDQEVWKASILWPRDADPETVKCREQLLAQLLLRCDNLEAESMTIVCGAGENRRMFPMLTSVNSMLTFALHQIGDLLTVNHNEATSNPEPPRAYKSYHQAFQALPTYQKQTSGDMELFIPEILESCAKDRNSCEYRFLCPHAGQFKCKLTNLVFQMEGKGVVVYRIGSWDRRLLVGLPQNEPAGPVYSIDCHEGSISYLHLPHCETCTDEVKLTAAHVTGGNLEILQPLKVTDTHAIIQIHSLSLYGLIKALFFQVYPIRAQVLLFCKKVTGNRRKNKLHIHLLPQNVPVKEVEEQYKCNKYIETTSKCKLTPGKTYRPCCKSDGRDQVHQPQEDTFECDYGPNYHPTFEVLFNSEVKEVMLSLLDEDDQAVWAPRTVLLTDTEGDAANMDLTGADFVDEHRATLIQNVSSVMEIADCLRARIIITQEMYSKINAKETPQDQMREVYTHLDSAGRAAKAEFYQMLLEKQKFLMKELKHGSVQD